MTVKAKVKVKTRLHDSARYLTTDEVRAIYLEEAFETEDPAFIAHSLGVVARAYGMTAIAKETGLGRESLYKTLSETGNPELATVIRIVAALGLRLTIEPAKTGPKSRT